MEVLVFRTDIKTRKRMDQFAWVFNQHPYIINWNVDLQDIDKVLRVEASNSLSEDDVIDMVQTFGFSCEALTD
ncbi:hypothetical protein SAMN04488029_0096 [Reichenbachiella faecimaris]|uniref:Uncharacterized protein n=1 Tax=Reichenbachiella faecimaris TaxID=692418 RepID=A0A1W2G500_REIFA|nr:hypothetical protein [Reichenbachiella faecimaris]SMD31759.1 hypothetical protein SAMN04488029_0096 [Reichenbachiella faecimaris]